MTEFETPDDEVCAEVLEHRQRRRAWEAENAAVKFKSATANKPVGAKAVSPNESQGVIEAFGRLVSVERTKHPGWTRQQAVRAVARTEPGMYQLYLKALTGRPGIDRPLTA